MGMKRTLLIIIACTAITGCDPTTVKTILKKGLEAAPGLIERHSDAKGLLCNEYMSALKGPAEEAWASVWPGIQSRMDAAAVGGPASLEAGCNQYLTDMGVTVIPKPNGKSSATALSFFLAVPERYGTLSPAENARWCWHEAAHIAVQREFGEARFIKQYVNIWGRVVHEALSNAVGDYAMHLTGVSDADRKAHHDRFSATFAQDYLLSKGKLRDLLLPRECSVKLFRAFQDEFDKRVYEL